MRKGTRSLIFNPVRSLIDFIDVSSWLMIAVCLLLFSTTTKKIRWFVYVTISSLINTDKSFFWLFDFLRRCLSYWYLLLILRNLELHFSNFIPLCYHRWLFIWVVYCEYVLNSSLQRLFTLITKQL